MLNFPKKGVLIDLFCSFKSITNNLSVISACTEKRHVKSNEICTDPEIYTRHFCYQFIAGVPISEIENHLKEKNE